MVGIYIHITEGQREALPPSNNSFPLMQGIHLPIMERGIKGVR
jgi:hypothetical protein